MTMTDIKETLGAMVEGIAQDLETCNTYAENDGEYWGEDILDVEIVGSLRCVSGFTVSHATLALTLGGPNVFADIYPDGRLVVRGYWGSDRSEFESNASPSLVDWCDNYAQGVADSVRA